MILTREVRCALRTFDFGVLVERREPFAPLRELTPHTRGAVRRNGAQAYADRINLGEVTRTQGWRIEFNREPPTAAEIEQLRDEHSAANPTGERCLKFILTAAGCDLADSPSDE
jgi:hypothetical protein